MNLKYSLVLSVMTILSTMGVKAQSNAEEVEMFQALYGMEKKEVAIQLVSPAEEKAEAFWKLYDEYEVERKVIGRKRVDLLNKYAAMYSELNAENVGPLVKEAMEIRTKHDALIARYHKKISSQIDAVTAAQFYQLEHYFQSEINVAIYRSIPMVGELIILED